MQFRAKDTIHLHASAFKMALNSYVSFAPFARLFRPTGAATVAGGFCLAKPELHIGKCRRRLDGAVAELWLL